MNAPVQMEREVALLRQAKGALSSNDLEPMLTAIAENVQSARPPAAIDFVTDELTLNGFALPAPTAATLTQGLARAGYRSQVSGDQWVIKRADAASLSTAQTLLTKP